MEHVGKPLDEWQAHMVIDSLALRPDGYWASFEVVGLVPRQNGKGAFTEAIELAGLFLFGDQIIMHSAHLFKTAKQSFQRIVDIIDGSSWLSARCAKPIRSRGDEEIRVLSKYGGGRLLYFSRSGGAGRGFTGDKTVFDEAAYLTIEQYQAATPTLATVPNPQIVYTGTPPDEDVGPMPDDAMMPSVRKRATNGGDRISIHEWSPKPGFDRNDPAVHAQCNPAYGEPADGGRIPGWFLQKQLDNFAAAGKPGKFDTEHLGVWPPDADEGWAIISEPEWARTLDELSAPDDPVIFAIDVTPERTHAAIAVVGARSDGDLHGELIDHRPDTHWVAQRVEELVAKWKPWRVVVYRGGAAGSLIPELNALLVPKYLEELTLLTAREIAYAYGLFHQHVSLGQAPGESVQTRRLRVRERAPYQTTGAVKLATTRRIEEGTVWNRRSDSTDLSPLIALTNALYGFVALPAPEIIVPPATAPMAPSPPFFRSTSRLKLGG